MLTTQMLFLAAYMTIAGVLGGIANHLTSPKDNSKTRYSNSYAHWATSIILGVIAAFITPLFLSLTKSDLFNNLVSQNNNKYFFNSDVFVFFGFCLVASFSSRIFIDSITKKIVELKEDVKSLEEKTDIISETQQEISENAIPILPIESSLPDDSDYGENEPPEPPSLAEMKILKALSSSNYTWRRSVMLAREVGLPQSFVSHYLSQLSARGFVSTKPARRDAVTLYSITSLGRSAVESSQ